MNSDSPADTGCGDTGKPLENFIRSIFMAYTYRTVTLASVHLHGLALEGQFMSYSYVWQKLEYLSTPFTTPPVVVAWKYMRTGTHNRTHGNSFQTDFPYLKGQTA